MGCCSRELPGEFGEGVVPKARRGFFAVFRPLVREGSGGDGKGAFSRERRFPISVAARMTQEGNFVREGFLFAGKSGIIAPLHL